MSMFNIQKGIMDIYMSGQQTDLAYEIISYFSDAKKVVCSSPPFNVRKAKKEWSKFTHISCPSYGMAISNKLEKIFSIPMLKQFFRIKGIRLPTRVFDTFWLKKLRKIERFYEFLVANGYEDQADKINEIVDDLAQIDFKKDDAVEKYNELLKTHFSDMNIEDNLEFSKFLRLFNLPDDFIQRVLTEKVPNEDETYAHHSLRWIINAISCHKMGPGCMTDVVNTIFAMMDRKTPTEDIEEEVVCTLGCFAHILENHEEEKSDLAELWLPEVYIADMESDDELSYGLLCYVKYLMEMKDMETNHIHLICQVPQGFEPFVSMVRRCREYVFEDPDSANRDALNLYWM